MHQLSRKIALIAVAAAVMATTPVLAAPPNGPGPGPGPRIDCSDPANANNPFCMPNGGRNGRHDHNNGPGNGPGNWSGNGPGNGPGNGGPPPPPPNGNPPPSPPPQGGMGPPPSGFHWSQRDRDQFHRQFRGFNFGFFGVPGFSIQLGVRVPHSYDLRPVPRSIYRDYPQFRGYLFFVTRHGDLVIVSPKSYRIIAII